MKTLVKFKEFVDEINKENGRLYKQSVLEKYKDDEDIKYYLNFIFNSFIVTGISDKKINKNLGVARYSKSLNQYGISDNFKVSAMLNTIAKNNTGTDEMIRKVQSALEIIRYYYDDNLVDLCKAIITKSLSIGCDTKTINKIIPGLIPEFNVMLANKYFEDPERVTGKDFVLTTKIDGSRIIAIKENGNVTFYSRQGQVYEGLVDLENELKSVPYDNICFDGELTLLNPGNLTSKDQYKETMKISRKDGEKHGLKMLVFDVMTSDEFRNQKCDIWYEVRHAQLNEIFLNTEFTYFENLKALYQGNDTKMISKILDEQVANGEEGIMINISDAPYEFTRTWNLMKVKKMQTLDLEVVDYFEGDKSFAGMLGGFIVRYKDGNLVKVGSGYDKEFRINAWKNPVAYIGRIIEVQYFEETTNQQGGLSLRFPVFKDIRTDKAEADY